MTRQTRRTNTNKTDNWNPLKSQWARDYQSWYHERYNTDAPHITAETGPDGTTYTTQIAYNVHIAPTSNFKQALLTVKNNLPNAAHYTVTLSSADGRNIAQITYMSNGIEIMNALTQFTKGAKVKVKVEGGAGEEWRSKAGFILANMLGDPSFDYELELPIPLEKWNHLSSIL